MLGQKWYNILILTDVIIYTFHTAWIFSFSMYGHLILSLSLFYNQLNSSPKRQTSLTIRCWMEAPSCPVLSSWIILSRGLDQRKNTSLSTRVFTNLEVRTSVQCCRLYNNAATVLNFTFLTGTGADTKILQATIHPTNNVSLLKCQSSVRKRPSTTFHDLPWPSMTFYRIIYY